MDKKLRFAVALLVAVASLPLAAADVKIGYVDINRIMRESGMADRIAKKLEKEFSARAGDMRKLADQITSRQSDLQKGGANLSDADRRDREREVARMVQDLNRMQREFREDQNIRRNEELAGLQERANNTINQIATTEKFDLILQEAVYISPKLDITDKVLKAMADK